MNKAQPENERSSFRQQRVCPSWLCPTFDNMFRKPLQNPERILGPYVKSDWIVLDVGPGKGYFTIPLAKLVGNSGKVIAADLQKKMLEGIYRRALKDRVEDRIILHQCTSDKIGISEVIDFCLAFWMVHEVLDRSRFLGEISSRLKPGGLLLLVEPKLHVSKEKFNDTIRIAKSSGLSNIEQPRIFFSYATLLKKELWPSQ
jgi:ubiquinone/menaquinone biosynthesis C-methylase UbiE